jgi:hypothetical protein
MACCGVPKVLFLMGGSIMALAYLGFLKVKYPLMVYKR